MRKMEVSARNRLLPQLLKQPPVPMESWLDKSPYPLADVPVEQQWRLFVAGLYQQPQYSFQRGLIWIGSLEESGTPDHAMNFKTRNEWLEKAHSYGPQISPCVFKDTNGNRKKSLVESRDYFIAESDPKADGTGLTREQFGIIIEWIRKRTTLRAIVDTGGKSLHAWFDVFDPPPHGEEVEKVGHSPAWVRTPAGLADWHRWKTRYDLAVARDRRRNAQFWKRKEEFFAVLKGLHCDPAMFQSLTARLPGWQRRDNNEDLTGRYQRLIYFNPKYPIDL
jgi:hypothetical protein